MSQPSRVSQPCGADRSASPAPRAQRIVDRPAPAAVFLVLTVAPGSEEWVRDLLGDLPGVVRGVGFRAADGDLSCVVGLGADLWDRTFDAPRPAGLHRFAEIAGERHTAVSTPGDLLFHIRAGRFDLCFEVARQLADRASGHASVVDEVHGFRYFDERDLLGFVDGTENPEGSLAVRTVSIAEEDPAYAGGSYVIVQKYLHDLDAWRALSVEQQEAAIGRSKLEDVEQPDEQKAANSHVALNTLADADGSPLRILRENMAFGRAGERTFGTYFIGYAADPAITERMLSNMFIGDPPGNHDRILDFSTAVTGALFFVPTLGFLEDPPAAPAEA